jgi:2-keto-4-pentenoate hydratase
MLAGTGIGQAQDDSELAQRLLAARAGSAPLPADLDVERAYAIQAELTRRLTARGERVIGYKAAFTTPGAQRAMGVDAPAYAPLFASMLVESGAVPFSRYTAPRAEVEVAFRLGRDLRAPFDPQALRAAAASIHVALELPDVRIEGKVGAAALIADGAGARAFALGPPREPAGLDVAALSCSLEVDGARFTQGTASEALGDPWKSLEWLAREHLRRGGRLAAGDVILTGALGEIWVQGETRPRELVARCDELGEVRVRVD